MIIQTKKGLKQARNLGKKLAAGFGAAAMSGAVMAADHSAAITAAGTDGTTNTTAAVVALLGIVAVVVGVGFILKVLNKS